MRSTAHLQLGAPEAALTELDRWLAAEPERHAVRSARGGLLSLLGREDAAWADLDAALVAVAAAGPGAGTGGGGLLPTRIAFCRRSGRHEQAREELARAVAAAPGDPSVLLERLLVAARTAAPAGDPGPWVVYEGALASGQDPAPAGARGVPAALGALVRCALADWPRADRRLDALLEAGPSWLAVTALEQDLGYLAGCPWADHSRLTVRRDRVRAARRRMEPAAPPPR